MPENAAIVPVAMAVLEPAYAKLGVTVKIRAVPLRRGLQMADAGELDGDLVRPLPSLKDLHNLITVKVPVARAMFSAYRLGPPCPASVSIAELTTARVAYMRGSRPVEDALPAAALREATNNLDALRHVQRGLTGYAVVGQMETDALIIKHGLKDLCKVPEPVVTTALFHSLNRKHAALAARLERVLQEMSDRGEIKRIWVVARQRAQKALLAAP